MDKEKTRIGKAAVQRRFRRRWRLLWCVECMTLASKLCMSSVMGIWAVIGMLTLMNPEVQIGMILNGRNLSMLVEMVLAAIIAPFYLICCIEENIVQWLLSFALAYLCLLYVSRKNAVGIFLACALLRGGLYFIFEIYRMAVKRKTLKAAQVPVTEKRFPVGDRVVLVHESGHAVMASLLGLPLAEISLGEGRVSILPIIFDKDGVKKMIMVFYAGIIAERIYLNDSEYLSMSARNDIEEATKCMQTYFSECGGMGSLISWSVFNNSRKIKEKCEEFSVACEKKATELLLQNKKKLDETIHFLSGKGEVTKEEWEAFWISSQQRA